jgi:hypothetical protein
MNVLALCSLSSSELCFRSCGAAQLNPYRTGPLPGLACCECCSNRSATSVSEALKKIKSDTLPC